MSNRFLRLWPLLALVGSGCHFALLPRAIPPATGTVAADQRVATWHRAIQALLEAGYVPQVLNESACFVSAEMRDDVSLGTLSHSRAFVLISPEGRVEVEASGSGEYASQGALAADVERIQRDLLARIVRLSTPKHTGSWGRGDLPRAGGGGARALHAHPTVEPGMMDTVVHIPLPRCWPECRRPRNQAGC